MNQAWDPVRHGPGAAWISDRRIVGYSVQESTPPEGRNRFVVTIAILPRGDPRGSPTHDPRSPMKDSRFPDVPGGYPFPRLEEEVLEEWKRGRRVRTPPSNPPPPGAYPPPRGEEGGREEGRRGRFFEQSLSKPAPAGSYVFFEGPPTANNVPHVGPVVTRAFKDLFTRYRTLRGPRA